MGLDNYTVQELNITEPLRWDKMLSSYVDYNLYQTYGWGELKKEQGWNIIRLACYNGEKDVALLQCLYKHYRMLNAVVLWIPGGPVILKEDTDLQLQDLRFMLTSILRKFKNKLFYIRMYPMQHYNSDIILALRSSGFQRPIACINYGLTYHINTLLPEKDIYDSLTSNWRHNLKRSESEELTFVRSDSTEEFYRFYDIYLQETKQNGLKVHYSKDNLNTLRKHLSPFGTLNLFVVFSKGEIVSGRLVCLVGRRVYDLIAAVTFEGRKKYATYSLIWGIIKWCKEKNIEYFDIGGIDPFRHQNIFNFKKGLGGQLAEYIGEWEFSRSFPLRLLTNWYISALVKD